jgi:hypothetical protein
MVFACTSVSLRQAHQRKFCIQKADVERRVVNDQLGALQKIDQRSGDLRELRLVAQKIGGEAVYRERARIAVAFGVHVEVQVIARQAAVHQLDAADFDDAVATARVQARSFGIEDDLTHVGIA